MTLIGAVPARAAGLSASEMLASLTVRADDAASYQRAVFQHWIDADADGCDTRREVLIAEATRSPAVGPGCSLSGGSWYSAYDGVETSDPSTFDVDHVVPLHEAWVSGAALWASTDRRAYANDLDFDRSLIAVSATSNRSKSDRDPSSWMPALPTYACEYAVDWVAVKYRWRLWVDEAERLALEQRLATDSCGARAADVTRVTPSSSSFPSPSSLSAVRFGGADRFGVAVGISQEFAPGVPVVYIAKGTDYPDSLSAAPAAAAAGGPLLLTMPTALPGQVEAEIRRLAPEKIVVVGGIASVSESVYAQLAALAPEIQRLGGADRYEASRNIVRAAFPDGATRVYLATGAKFPDALSASAAAGKMGGAVVLVDGAASSLDDATRQLLAHLAPHDVVIAGGPASVSTGIEQHVAALGLPGGSRRLAGSDRFEASLNINADAFSAANTVFLATGMNFPDALAGGPLAAIERGPLYVVPGTCVPASTAAHIRSLAPSKIVLLGGPNSLSPAVETLTECSTAPEPAPSPTPDPAPPTNPGDTKNCNHFSTWSEAQAWFTKYFPHYGDVAKLDGNNDGIACESLPGAP
ncbi:cell wall-binding repeat-containing protein [Salinibacterium sp. ZJ77]|uniref:cell wall-binding repeat-containing protein n=1 Tax=Salinibacterium sp. ZJ77 TaxID=2708337 RepID=UPI001AB0396C|nr:cell wall-binding repeat-containing protein [Salinibacterium sp. ZJ77]